MTLNIIPTVYSFVFPEVKEDFDALRGRENLGELYERAWTKRQDPMHFKLMKTWQEWTKEALNIEWKSYEHNYVCAGSSEAIRASIATHTALARKENRTPRIHIFEGEYEGYRAYAEAFFCEVVTHKRGQHEGTLRRLAQKGDRFYLSAPSAIDGNVWKGLNAFLHFLDAKTELSLAIDLCYVGCTTKAMPKIDLNIDALDTVFFSLSKVFGVYYHRIGGVFTKAPMPALVGNRWFKNLLSIEYGTELMQKYSLGELPQRYKNLQHEIVQAAQSFGRLKASDVVLLAYENASGSENDVYKRLPDLRRFCLTPELDARANA